MLLGITTVFPPIVSYHTYRKKTPEPASLFNLTSKVILPGATESPSACPAPAEALHVLVVAESDLRGHIAD